ncbi:hypothetical protein BJ546DRAFT_82822 [Cryomyces antarcticus]
MLHLLSSSPFFRCHFSWCSIRTHGTIVMSYLFLALLQLQHVRTEGDVRDQLHRPVRLEYPTSMQKRMKHRCRCTAITMILACQPSYSCPLSCRICRTRMARLDKFLKDHYIRHPPSTRMSSGWQTKAGAGP